MNSPRFERGYFFEFLMLAAGALLGYVAAWWLHGFDFSDPGELIAARETGIVSLTILSGYAKSRDIHNYAFTLALPILGALILWWASRVRSPSGKALLGGNFSKHAFAIRSFCFAIVMIVLFSWHSFATLHAPWNPHVGAWPFLGEQGATLAWRQNLSTGGVFGRDFFSLYGPMFIYPLSWLMDITGSHSAIMERYYKFLLQMIAIALLSFLMLRTVRSKLLAWSMVIGVVFIHPALMHSANNSLLRSALPLFALCCLVLWLDTRRKSWLWAGGLVMGQSLLFSQEAAICALMAGSMIIILDSVQRSRSYVSATIEVVRFWGIAALSISPMLIYLIIKGAGAAFVDSLVGYPKLVMLGFGSLPFPSMREWIPGRFREHGIHYAVIAIYSGSAVALALAWIKGQRSGRLLWGIGLTLFGALLFRQALGRSGNEQTIRIMMPALILTAFWLDEAWAWIQSEDKLPSIHAVSITLASLLLTNLGMGIVLDIDVRQRIIFAWVTGTQLEGKFYKPSAQLMAQIHPRVGFLLDADTRQSIAEISAFLERNTAPEDPVYFFPQEAAYYHVFNRTNPTRYAISYFASSFDRQREVIRDLDAHAPQFVIYSKSTWRVDNIQERVQVPLIVDYLDKNYQKIQSTRTVEILERFSPPVRQR